MIKTIQVRSVGVSFVVTLISVLGFFLPTLSAFGAPNNPPKRVLIIDSFGRDTAPFNAGARSLKTTLAQELQQPLDIYEVSLDAARFVDSLKETAFADFLEHRFGDRALDLVVPIGAPAVSFVARHRERLFPETPMLMAGSDQRLLRPEFLRKNTTIVTENVNLPDIIEDILQVLPETKNIVVVFGTSPLEKFWLAECQREFQRFENRVSFTWFNELSFQDIEKRAAALPPHTAILYGLFVLDAAGIPYDHDDALKSLHAVANAPIFGYFESRLGLGMVGGRLYQDRTIGVEAGHVAVRILKGESASSIPPRFLARSLPVYDWRELERWGISENRLPRGSLVRFKTPSLWEEYKWYIVAALAIIAIQAAIIANLLLQRVRRRRAEASLRESEQRMSLAASAANLGLWTWDMAHDEVWVTPEGRKFFGWDASEAINLGRFLDTLHPEDREPTRQAISRSLEHRDEYSAEYRVQPRDGTMRWIAAHGRVEVDGNGKPLRMLGVAIDVTERKLGEQALRESEKRFRIMADSAPVMIWMSDTDKLCTFFNKGWLDFTGRTLEQELGNGWAEGVHPEDLDRCVEVYHKSFDTRREFTMEYRLRRSDGEYRWVFDSGLPRFEPDGTFVGYIGSCIDISERKQVEKNLTSAIEEIRSLKDQLEEENLYLKEEISEVKGFEEIVGKSDALKYVLTRVEQVAKTDATVLLQGETGVGKELIARSIHEKSSRSDGPLVKVNCATLPEALVESELFGHEKGAFTGADRQRKGRFELADGGTIFLDEVGELQLGTQAKLLRVLQEGEFERIGGTSTIKVKVRVIAATNRKLYDEISAGRFRQDLFYRLNVYPVTIPPLRQRRDDIPLLVSYLARQIGERLGKTITEVPAQVMHEFTQYDWPGNIRELQNVIERAVIVSSDEVLRLSEPLVKATTARTRDSEVFSEPVPVSTLDEAEREHILRALETTGWRINGPKGAAAMLKLHPSTLRFRMKKLGLTKVSGYISQVQKSSLH